MRKKCRSQVVLDTTANMIALFAYVQDSPRWDEWKFRKISLERALRMEAKGEAEAVTRKIDGEVRVVGYRSKKPTRASKPSATTLTENTLNAVGTAAFGGPLEGWERGQVCKFLLWPFEYDRKNAATVRPRFGMREMARAQSALQAA